MNKLCSEKRQREKADTDDILTPGLGTVASRRRNAKHLETLKCNKQQGLHHNEVCDCLASEIHRNLRNLPETKNKIWYAHPA